MWFELYTILRRRYGWVLVMTKSVSSNTISPYLTVDEFVSADSETTKIEFQKELASTLNYSIPHNTENFKFFVCDSNENAEKVFNEFLKEKEVVHG